MVVPMWVRSVGVNAGEDLKEGKHGSLALKWFGCVSFETRLGPGPRQRGWQVQGVGSLVCTSEARKIRVPLVRARSRAP